MNMERAVLKGMLSDEKAKKGDLTLRIGTEVSAAKKILNAALLADKEEIDLVGANIHIKEALVLQNELKEVLEKIKTIERELNG